MSNENKPMERLIENFSKGNFDVKAEEIFAPTLTPAVTDDYGNAPTYVMFDQYEYSEAMQSEFEHWASGSGSGDGSGPNGDF